MNEETERFNKYGFGRWSWFALIERLAKGDITRFEEVCDQNFINCLNLLSYWKEKEVEDKKREDILKQNK